MHRKILFYGDSNTHGTAPMENLDQKFRFDLRSRWTGHTRNTLPSDWECIDEGLPGRTTLWNDPIEGDHLNGLDHLPVALYSHQPLDLVCIFLGTNDFKTRFNVQPLDILLSIKALTNYVVSSEAGLNQTAPKVLVIVPPPIREIGILGELFFGGESKSKRLNDLAPDFLREHNLWYIMAGNYMEVSKIDGIHYDKKGHELLGKAVGQAILRKIN